MSSTQISALAEQFGASEALVSRSVQARATASGVSIEEILAVWSGGAPPPQPVQKESPPEVAPAPAPEPILGAVTSAEDRTPVAEPVDPAAEVNDPEEPTDRIVQTTQSSPAGFSLWMVAAFLAIPLFGLLYLVVNSNGVSCGDGGSLQVAFDGTLVNCDGSAFEGRGGGGAEALALLVAGEELYGAGAQCASCHGANGQGGTGPAFTGGAVLATWPSCDDHVEWIALGSDGWSAAIGSTYGAEDKPIQGGMPAFASDLSEEELRAVAAFERIRFGGAPAEETLIACGLIVPEEPADAPTEGEPATEG